MQNVHQKLGGGGLNNRQSKRLPQRHLDHPSYPGLIPRWGQFFSKVGQKLAVTVLVKKVLFFKEAQKSPNFWATFGRKFVTKYNLQKPTNPATLVMPATYEQIKCCFFTYVPFKFVFSIWLMDALNTTTTDSLNNWNSFWSIKSKVISFHFFFVCPNFTFWWWRWWWWWRLIEFSFGLIFWGR